MVMFKFLMLICVLLKRNLFVLVYDVGEDISR